MLQRLHVQERGQCAKAKQHFKSRKDIEQASGARVLSLLSNAWMIKQRSLNQVTGLSTEGKADSIC